jgi:hypothetical protein
LEAKLNSIVTDFSLDSCDAVFSFALLQPMIVNNNTMKMENISDFFDFIFFSPLNYSALARLGVILASGIFWWKAQWMR